MTMNEHDLQDHCARMVQNEVNCCLSMLVSTLAGANGNIGAMTPQDLYDLCEQAQELRYGVPDYEEAAIQAGWTGPHTDEFGATYFTNDENSNWAAADWQALCADFEIETGDYAREVYEHWAVSGWLADKLEAQGERIDHDFAGLHVWSRTTTGQAISMDGVICRIVLNVHNAIEG
jgi:hypothetical protein